MWVLQQQFETVKRLSTHIVHERISRGILPELRINTLTVVSVDNIDILQPHALVSATDATRSWHGTSVQAMQPMPSLTQETPMPAASPNKKPCSSPAASPVAVLRAKRRRRTLTEQPSPHTEITLPQGSEPELQLIQPMDNSPTTRKVTIESFILQDKEISVLSNFNESLFAGNILKEHESTRDKKTLPALTPLTNCIHLGPSEHEKSNVEYVKILSARADSKETLGSVLAKLYKTFIVEYKQR